MIDDIELGLKIFKYGLNKKGTLTAMYLFAAIGVLFTIIVPFTMIDDMDSSVSLGGMYLGITGMFIPQLIITNTVSKMVQASQYKYKLQVVIPCRISMVFSLVSYSVFCGVNLLEEVIINRHWMIAEEAFSDYLSRYITAQIITVSVFLTIMQIYNLLVYKMTAVGYIASFIIIIPAIIIILFAGMRSALFQEISRGTALIIGYAAIIAGSLIGRLLAKVMYRRELCTLTYKAALNKDRAH